MLGQFSPIEMSLVDNQFAKLVPTPGIGVL
jgi:hypothetical protein